MPKKKSPVEEDVVYKLHESKIPTIVATVIAKYFLGQLSGKMPSPQELNEAVIEILKNETEKG